MTKTKLQIDNPSLSDEVSEHYKKFFAKFTEINTLPIEDWRVVHLLGYLCKKYEEHYGTKYSFKFDNPTPSKSYEIFQIKKLANMLTSDPKVLRDYLDWAFKHKIIEKKKRVTSLGFFTHQDIINDYKFKFLLNKKTTINRTDRLPQNIVAMCARKGFSAHTYAELAFIKKMPDQEQLFDELRAINFQVDILDKIV